MKKLSNADRVRVVAALVEADEDIIVAGRIKHADVDEALRLIRFSPSCPPKNRPAVLLHELAHSWCWAALRWHLRNTPEIFQRSVK